MVNQQQENNEEHTLLFAGEDACFLSVNGQSIGVADGVGAWKSKGFDSSLLSRSLMSHCRFLMDSQRSNGHHVLSDAYRMIREENVVPAGSTTACCLSIVVDNGREHNDVRSGENDDSGVTIVGHVCV